MPRFAFVLLITLGAVPAPALAKTVRIRVLGLFRPRELVLSPAPNRVVVVQGNAGAVILQDGRAVRFRVSADSVQCVAGERVFYAKVARASARAGSTADLVLGVPGKIERRYRGTIEVSASGDELVAVVVMDREVAVASAVAAESPPGASIEALKAQAVVTRSYYTAARHRHVGFDFCDTTHCQFLREPPVTDAVASLATETTRGLVLSYKGSVLAALFSASCGGQTRSLRQVVLPIEGYPYFPVTCAPCLSRARSWEACLDRRTGALLLAGEASEGARLRVSRTMGWNVIPGIHYSAWLEGDSVVVRGSGAGHGLGLCQLGAAVMAQQGSEFQDILNYYYPSTLLRTDN